MKITGNNHQPFAKDAASGKTVTDNKNSTALKGGKVDGSSVQIESGLASAKIKNELASMPEKNAEKVAALKNAIKSGSFKIDPQKIAGGLLREAAQDLASSRG